LLTFTLAFSAIAANKPDEATVKKIKQELKALSDPSNSARLESLKELNDLKAMYPDYPMKEFDSYLSSPVMRNATQSWLRDFSSDKPSVRHSVLHVLVSFKADFPQLNMSMYNDALTKMINKDPVEHIQVDAKIAYLYINSVKLASTIKLDKQDGLGDVFTYIHTQMDLMFNQENPSQGIAIESM